MNKGVEILLERMKSNPEEFLERYQHGSSKWSGLVNTYTDYLDDEDRKILLDAWKEATRQVMQERFTQAVMKELLDPKEQMEQALSPYQSATGLAGATLGQSTGVHNNGLTLTAGAGTNYQWANTGAVTGTINASALKLGNQTLDESTIEHMKAHAEYLKQQAKAQQAKSQTLVGKLYNYLGSNK